MSSAHKITLIGFSAFEKATFESFFRLAARRPPGYVLITEAAEADLAVVNADDTAVLKQAIASKPSKQVLLIGNQDGGTGWAIQKRPLNLMKVLATVESLLGSGQAAPGASVQANPVVANAPQIAAASHASSASAPLTPMSRAAPAAQSPHESYAATVTGALDNRIQRSVRTGGGFAASSQFANSRGGLLGGNSHMGALDDPDMDHILVVDDSDIALKFMRNRLTRFGFHTDLVNSGEDALGRLNVKPYKFVFLDVMMEGLDGYQTCRAIKQRKYTEGKPPVVVMLTSRGGTIDKIRGTLAGCDAYLTKPLNERDLIAVLAKHDKNVARGFQETNMGTGGKSDFGISTRA